MWTYRVWYAQYLIAVLEFRWPCPSAFLGVLIAVVELSWFGLARNFHPNATFLFRV